MQVLILEDDDNLRELLADAVESLDHLVKQADSATMALHMGREFDFELVISDIRMAGPTDGLGVLQALKQRQPNMACIVITGYADKTAPLRALQIRVDDYLYKPFEIEHLVEAIDRVRSSLISRETPSPSSWPSTLRLSRTRSQSDPKSPEKASGPMIAS